MKTRCLQFSPSVLVVQDGDLLCKLGAYGCMWQLTSILDVQEGGLLCKLDAYRFLIVYLLYKRVIFRGNSVPKGVCGSPQACWT